MQKEHTQYIKSILVAASRFIHCFSHFSSATTRSTWSFCDLKVLAGLEIGKILNESRSKNESYLLKRKKYRSYC